MLVPVLVLPEMPVCRLSSPRPSTPLVHVHVYLVLLPGECAQFVLRAVAATWKLSW